MKPVVPLIFDIESSGLDPFISKVASICLKNPLTNQLFVFCNGRDEKKTLEEFWGFVRSNEPVDLIGFCSNTFDIPYLLRRSIIQDVKVYTQFQTKDLRKIANGFFYSYNSHEPGKLVDWASALGFQRKTSLGSEVPELYAQDKFDEIKEHNIEDVQITELLYNRLKRVGLI